MLRRFLLPLLPVPLLCACTTTEDLRAQAPVRAAIFAGEYRQFAECVNFRLEDRVLYDAENKIAYVGNDPTTGAPGPAIAFYEISVRQADTQSVAVELKQRWGIAAARLRKTYWLAVEACGK